MLAALVAVLLVAGTVAALTGVGDTPAEPAAAPPAGRADAPPDTFVVTPPQGWTSVSAPAAPLDVFGVPFTRLTEVPPFAAGECPADPAPRGVAATALVAVPAGTSVAEAAQAFARGAGEAAYAGATPQVAVGPAGPRPGPDDAEDGVWVEATVRTDGTAAGRPGCRATDGTVGVLAVPRTQARDGSTGVAMLLVAADVGGGPGDPVSRDAPGELASSATRPG
ncbi:hypothetical protein C8E95_5950 [Pseudonocardia autotrophica]|uniref:PknH-like extracellular domain-containing protein n=1 Tax=Pseudonocardia autotrophica TaxID=2074 RepID=A0A1Y2N2Z5_PSEAH|nr:hypothetical protein BG845_02180 [Pseudonocardia autotrophica]TDN76733.1 hypothetical protein C8E95_5950 [Pseudonocardia autotrophica]